MKKFKFLVLVAILFAIAQPKTTEAQVVVSCPTQPKIQGKVNHIFFPFYEKLANIGSYIPANLVLIDQVYLKGGPRCLTKQSYTSFVAMNTALYAQTSNNLVISSAWRSVKTQMYFARMRGEFAAVPGRSEHQLGTTVDLDILGSKEEDYFGNSSTYQWMVLHAHEYGFVQSFNLEGETANGIPNEPWHWRYVGPTIATKVKLENININEYLYKRMEARKNGLIY